MQGNLGPSFVALMAMIPDRAPGVTLLDHRFT
jgi:hypothetical protein